jgi:hypothetical protein
MICSALPWFLAVWLAFGIAPASGQSAAATNLSALNESGNITVEGRSLPYLIRHLPIDSFPDLPAAIQAELNRRGCLIPQTYEAHRPENVVHGRLQGPNSSDWAVLCSAKGTVSLLVFFTGDASAHGPSNPFVVASAPETERLQAHGRGDTLGFNWGIDRASPQQVHDAQAGLVPRPPLIDHDALADSTIDHRTIYHFYAKSAWTLLDMPY